MMTSVQSSHRDNENVVPPPGNVALTNERRHSAFGVVAKRGSEFANVGAPLRVDPTDLSPGSQEKVLADMPSPLTVSSPMEPSGTVFFIEDEQTVEASPPKHEEVASGAVNIFNVISEKEDKSASSRYISRANGEDQSSSAMMYPVTLTYADSLGGAVEAETGLDGSAHTRGKSEEETVADVENGVDPNGGGLDPEADPFAIREGRTLTWQNVNMTLVSVCKFLDLVKPIQYPKVSDRLSYLTLIETACNEN